MPEPYRRMSSNFLLTDTPKEFFPSMYPFHKRCNFLYTVNTDILIYIYSILLNLVDSEYYQEMTPAHIH